MYFLSELTAPHFFSLEKLKRGKKTSESRDKNVHGGMRTVVRLAVLRVLLYTFFFSGSRAQMEYIRETDVTSIDDETNVVL